MKSGLLKALAISLPLITLSCGTSGPPRPIVKSTSNFSWQRTIDTFDKETGIYHNEDIPLQITFPRGWNVDYKTEKTELWSEAEKFFGMEMAMFAQAGELLAATVTLEKIGKDEKGVFENLSSIEYANLIKDINFSDAETVMTERNINGLNVADFVYETRESPLLGPPLKYHELVFHNGDYGCRIRAWTAPSLYNKYEQTIENMLSSVQIGKK